MGKTNGVHPQNWHTLCYRVFKLREPRKKSKLVEVCRTDHPKPNLLNPDTDVI
jgi:hypothetical protein